MTLGNRVSDLENNYYAVCKMREELLKQNEILEKENLLLKQKNDAQRSTVEQYQANENINGKFIAQVAAEHLISEGAEAFTMPVDIEGVKYEFTGVVKKKAPPFTNASEPDPEANCANKCPDASETVQGGSLKEAQEAVKQINKLRSSVAETLHLLSTKNNTRELMESIAQLVAGDLVTTKLDNDPKSESSSTVDRMIDFVAKQTNQKPSGFIFIL